MDTCMGAKKPNYERTGNTRGGASHVPKRTDAGRTCSARWSKKLLTPCRQETRGEKEERGKDHSAAPGITRGRADGQNDLLKKGKGGEMPSGCRGRQKRKSKKIKGERKGGTGRFPNNKRK